METQAILFSNSYNSRIHFLIFRGTFFGCLIVCFLCCILTTSNSSVNKTIIVHAAVEPIAKTEVTVNPECLVSDKYPSSIVQWCKVITTNAEQTGLAPDLLAALIWQESGGDTMAYSSSGAVGLMQVMPRDGLAKKFACINGPCFADRPSIKELEDPEFNVRYGARILSGLVKQYGSLREALKAYGPMDVGYYYADKILGIYQQYGE